MRGARGRSGWHTDLAVAAGLTLLLLGPALLPGYVLRGDMVFVPQQPWKDAWLGLDGAFPRSAPMDALVSVLTVVVPGWVVQKILLVGALVGGGLGAGRLVAGSSALGRAAAVTLFVWNPYVAERLLIGQWAVVLGYAVLPWVVLAVVRHADGLSGGRSALVVTLAVGALASPSSGLMSAAVAVLVAVGLRAGRSAAYAVGLAGVVNLPWVLPALLSSSASVTAGADQFRAFAARSESAAGLLPSLWSLGGIWKTSIVPQERTSVIVVLLAGAVTTVALVGLRSVTDPRQRRLLPGLGAVAGFSLALAWGPALPGVADLLGDAAEVVPGFGLLRDSHRYLGPAVLVLLPGLAAAVDAVLGMARPGRESLRAGAAALAVAPVLLLPGLGWGASGDLRAVSYPGEWQAVADLVRTEPDGATVVLPWTGSYRGFGWNDYRAMLDPAPRFLPGEVLVDDRVLLGEGRVLAGESRTGAEVSAALAATDPVERAARLRALGVRWVLVEKGHATGRPPQGQVRFDGEGLQLVDLGRVSRPLSPPVGRLAALAVVGADLVVVTLVLIAVSRVTMRASRRN